MEETFKIAIDSPCHQNWDDMTPDDRGRFCPACQKHVADFTRFSDAEFIAYFRRYPRPSDLCVKLTPRQMEIPIPPKPAPITFWTVNKLAAASLIAALGFTYKAHSQTKNSVYPSGIFENKPGIGFEKLLLITGKVKDKTGKPVPGTPLVVEGTTIQTITDIEGCFTLELPERDKSYTLVCGADQMAAQQIPINMPMYIDIVMETELSVNGAETFIPLSSGQKTTTYNLQKLPPPSYPAQRKPGLWKRIMGTFRHKKHNNN